jgi:starch synthase
VWELTERNVNFYFVHCPPLFDRDGIYGSGGADFPDNHIRYGVLSMAALGVARHLFPANIIHAHDWQTGLLPVYLREHFSTHPSFAGAKVLFTIHNLGYQGIFPPGVMPEIGLDSRLLNPDQLEFYGNLCLLKGGIAWSDGISTVSKGYAREIQTPEYGFGLDGFLRKHRPIFGIVNGVDYVEWDPENDPHIARNYSVNDLSGKRACKRALLEEFGLPVDLHRPLIGIVSRFASQKGFDLVADAASGLLAEDVSVVVLGSGEAEYEAMFRYLSGARPLQVGARIGYDNPLAHRIEAGADIFLMPSRYEPCGLNQIYSLKYGTIPVVRATGGLDDTIDEDTGFKFREYTGSALLGAVRAAVTAYHDQDEWVSMMRRGMQKDFSWSASAGEYMALYRQLAG